MNSRCCVILQNCLQNFFEAITLVAQRGTSFALKPGASDDSWAKSKLLQHGKRIAKRAVSRL